MKLNKSLSLQEIADTERRVSAPPAHLNSQPGVTYSYDANGNLLSKTDSNGTTSYTWDAENRLTSVTLAGRGRDGDLPV